MSDFTAAVLVVVVRVALIVALVMLVGWLLPMWAEIVLLIGLLLFVAYLEVAP